MSRVEENQSVIAGLAEIALKAGSATFERATVWQLGAMNAVLSDISKSLAVIADARGRKNDRTAKKRNDDLG